MGKIDKKPLSLSTKIRLTLWAIFIIGGVLISLYFDFKYFQNLLYSTKFHIITLILGLFLLKLSFHAASVGGKELAKKGRVGDIPRLETNRLVTSGIYSCTRHPMLFGLMLFPLSIALILGLPSFIFIIAPFEAVTILIMVLTLEEKEAYKKFGEKYIEYKKEVPALPKDLRCLKKLFFG